MYKRYLTIIIFLLCLIGCFFLFFNKQSNKEIYSEYLNKVQNNTNYNDLSTNEDLSIIVDYKYINDRYHYVLTFLPKKDLSNFKTMAVPNLDNKSEYYPSFGLIDNNEFTLKEEINNEDQTKGINLVFNTKEKVDSFKVYVSYNNCEYYYLLNVGEKND